jgi:hypothetical protein
MSTKCGIFEGIHAKLSRKTEEMLQFGDNRRDEDDT